MTRCGQRRLELCELVSKRRRIDLKQKIAGHHRHIRLDRNSDNLAGHIWRYLNCFDGDPDLAGGREVIKQRQKCRKDECADEYRDRPR